MDFYRFKPKESNAKRKGKGNAATFFSYISILKHENYVQVYQVLSRIHICYVSGFMNLGPLWIGYLSGAKLISEKVTLLQIIY